MYQTGACMLAGEIEALERIYTILFNVLVGSFIYRPQIRNPHYPTVRHLADECAWVSLLLLTNLEKVSQPSSLGLVRPFDFHPHFASVTFNIVCMPDSVLRWSGVGVCVCMRVGSENELANTVAIVLRICFCFFFFCSVESMGSEFGQNRWRKVRTPVDVYGMEFRLSLRFGGVARTRDTFPYP